jgi:hypothetical protein
LSKKALSSKQEQINYWVEQYLQAKVTGDRNKMKMFEAVIIKLGGKVPKL